MSRREDYIKGELKKGIQLLVKNADSTLQVNKIAATSLIDALRLPDEIRIELPNNSFARIVRANLGEYLNFEEK